MVKFEVLKSYGGQLEVLSEYTSSMWKMSTGKVSGQIGHDELQEAHQDPRLKAVDGDQELPEKFLILKTDRE